MSLVVEYALDAGGFALGRAAPPGVSVELDSVVEDGDVARQYFWVDGGGQATLRRALDGQSAVEGYTVLDDVGRARLYRRRCPLDRDTLLAGLARFPEDLLSGEGDDENWTLRLLFEDGSAAEAFRRFCVGEAGVVFDAERRYRAVEDTDLTDRQRRTLAVAREEGYFDIPRRTTLVDLAERLGVSDQAVSERLRRAQSKLVRDHLTDAPGTEEGDG